MQDEEARLKREIARLLKQAEALDRSEDAEQGSDGDDGGLPQELKRRADRLKVIQAAKARLEERQRQEDKADARTVRRRRPHPRYDGAALPTPVRGTVPECARELHRSGLVHHEYRRRLPAVLQRTGGGG